MGSMGNRRFKHRAGIRGTWAAMAFGLALLAGCASPPWRARSATPEKPVSSEAKATSPSKSCGSQADSQAMLQVISDLQQLGAIDPVARDELMADLKEVDPRFRPMELQAFQAAAAYRRREGEREAEKRKGEIAAADAPRKDLAVKTAVADSKRLASS